MQHGRTKTLTTSNNYSSQAVTERQHGPGTTTSESTTSKQPGNKWTSDDINDDFKNDSVNDSVNGNGIDQDDRSQTSQIRRIPPPLHERDNDQGLEYDTQREYDNQRDQHNAERNQQADQQIRRSQRLSRPPNTRLAYYKSGVAM